MSECLVCARELPTAHTACLKCQTKGREWVAALPGWYTQAATQLHPGQGNGEPTSGGDTTIGINLTALNIRHGADWNATLHSWWRLVEEERDLSPAPQHHGTAGATLQWHVDHLLTHTPWIYETAQWVADYHRELRQMWSAGRALCEGPPHQKTTVTCPTDGCARRIPIEPNLEAVIQCRYCGVERPVEFLVRAAGEVFADAEAVSVATGVPERTLRDWARRGHIRRRNGRYSLTDVQGRVVDRG